jgi:hypothetical protein
MRVVSGALGGLIGAACMTPLRLAARRVGLIDKTVSQAMEEWVAVRAPIRPRHPATHQLADQIMHLGYGAALGTIYGLAWRGRRSGTVGRGLLFGLGTWLWGSWVLMPALGAKRPAWRKHLRENATDLAAHLTFGLAAAITGEELSSQTDRGPTSDRQRRATRVG